MSLFKKPKGKFRSRVTRIDTDEEENSEPIYNKKIEASSTGDEINVNDKDDYQQDSPAMASSSSNLNNWDDKLKLDKKVVPKLSFGDDEEEESDVFQVKKSAYSRRIAKAMKKERKRREREKVEKELEIKKDDDEEDDNLISEKVGSQRRSNEEEEIIISVPDFEEPDRTYDPSFDSQPQRDIPIHEFKNVIQKGLIPDAKTIYAVKKQRQMARNIDEFISIESETAEERAKLGLADDDDVEYEEPDDEEDEDGRIDFAFDKEAYEREKAREAFILVQEEEEETLNNKNREDCDSEEELDRWEQEQIRKGVGSQTGSQSRFNRDNSSKLYNDLIHGPEILSHQSKNNSSSIPSFLYKSREKISKEEIIRQLNDVIGEMRLNVESGEKELRTIQSEKEECLLTIKGLGDKLDQLKSRYESLEAKHSTKNNWSEEDSE